MTKNVNIKITSDSSQVRNDLSATSKSFDDFEHSGTSSSEKVDSGFSKIGKTIGIGLLAASAATVTFGIGALKSAGDVEMLRANFDTLLGSAEAGKKLFTELQSMANITPFETTDLADASRTLLSFGVNIKDLLPDLKMLGDVSLGNKEKFNSLSLVFGQIQSKGALMGDDLRQLVNVGFNPLQKISERTGESMASLQQKMSNGQITFQMVSDEFKRATSEGGQFFNGMEKGAQTLPGLFSTLADTFNMTARSIVGLSASGDIVAGSLLDRLKNGIKDLIPFLNTLGEKMGPMLTSALNGLSGVAKGLEPIFNYLVPKFQALGESIGTKLVPVMSNLWQNILVPFGGFLGNVLTVSIGLVTDALKFLTDGASFFVPIILGGVAAMLAWDASILLSGGATTLWTTLTGLATAAQIAFNVALLSNPIGLVVAAIAGLSVAILGLIGVTQTNKDKTDTLTQANDALKASQDRLSETSMSLNRANLAVINSKEAEAAATQHAKDMLDQYGAKSPQYVKAQAELMVAHDNTTNAIKNQTVAIKDNNVASSDEASKQRVVNNETAKANKVNSVTDSINQQKVRWWDLNSTLNSFNGSVFTYSVVGKSSGTSIPGRFAGGSVSANIPYFVGENSDGSFNSTTELFVPSTSGVILNNSQLRSLLSPSRMQGLEMGGVVDKPMVRVFGENGSEAVMPLENNTGWIDKLAGQIAVSAGNNGQPLNLTVKIGEDAIASKIIDLINDRSQMSGRNAIMV